MDMKRGQLETTWTTGNVVLWEVTESKMDRNVSNDDILTRVGDKKILAKYYEVKN